jgi:predicted PhzF superfamily epimerase YddE/YHI9
LATALNLPATAFVRAASDGFALRWFSPAAELTLCGHGTLASAHALWEMGRLAPAARAGIPEDPVTGSAHCALGPLWAERLGTSTLTARQLSPRGGVLGLDVRGERVVLAGQAVTILRGEVAPSAGLVIQGRDRAAGRRPRR